MKATGEICAGGVSAAFHPGDGRATEDRRGNIVGMAFEFSTNVEHVLWTQDFFFTDQRPRKDETRDDCSCGGTQAP